MVGFQRYGLRSEPLSRASLEWMGIRRPFWVRVRTQMSIEATFGRLMVMVSNHAPKLSKIASVVGLTLTVSLITSGCADAAKGAANNALDATLSKDEKKLYKSCMDALNKATDSSLTALQEFSNQASEELQDELDELREEEDEVLDEGSTETTMAISSELKAAFGDEALARDCQAFFKAKPEQLARAIVEYSEKNKGKIAKASKEAQAKAEHLQKQAQQFEN